MKFDKSPQWLVQLFEALQTETGGAPRKMFGYPCAFENGQLFTGLFGDGMFVRLAEPDRAALLQTPGATPFAPMAGRPMKEYVVLPPSMLEDEEAVKGWLRRGLAYAQSLPPKQPKAAKAKVAKAKAAKPSRPARKRG
jgi:TfoX/Sxy family transcriptional regulator of competence genes